MVYPVLIALFLLGCERAYVKPDGFAPYLNTYENRAVTPDRVVYRVRKFENKKGGDLAFWKVALKTHMKDSGYIILSDEDVVAKETPGYLLKMAAPVANQDYIYLISIFIKDDNLYVIESAGEINVFAKYERNILQTINSTDLRGQFTN
ncbi:MAG: hypothetical protein OEZ58_11335 [Gammaproteobacteria bacterium]|nr:hypothetical protein [Gammaproteobacteria bacterium]MDH5729576.1 hypothetical protein [Gammaproteobacteria bacterium]